MKKIIFVLFIVLFFIPSKAQVGIGNGDASIAVNTADQIILYINNQNEDFGVKGFGLPAVDDLIILPYTGAARPASKINELRGMLMYVKSTNEAMVIDGQDWYKAFNVEGDNISRFRINAVSASDGVVNLQIDNTIDKDNYYMDPLKLKTNVSTSGEEVYKLYVRQSAVYRISIELVFTTTSMSSLSSRLGITINLNGGKRFDLLENCVQNNGTTYMVSLDTSVYVRQGDYLTFATVPDIGGVESFTITNASSITVEKIL